MLQLITVVTDPISGGGTSFQFDQVLSPGIDQAEVFRVVASKVVDGALSGFNGCILAYGQTGAGKTFTMSGGGSRRRFEDRGLIARALSRIFQRIQEDADHSYTVRVSYLEIYNDRLIDLLGSDVGTSTDLTIQENSRGQTFVRGLTKALVSSEEQALDLVFQGDTSRAVAEHALNAASSRSHCIFTLYLERKRSAMSLPLVEEDSSRDEISVSSQSEDNIVYSKLHLVDLAGSERMKKTLAEAGSTRASESCFINRSLTFLEQVVLALGSKNRAHIPYRQTPLTNLLKDSLGGNCCTLLIACIWLASTHANQSLATLRFAARMRRVKSQAIVNVVDSGSTGSKLPSEERAAYCNEIRRLREELVLHDAIVGRTRAHCDDKKKSAGLDHLQRQQITTFLRDAELVPPVQSLGQVKQLLHTFCSICLNLKASSEPTTNPKRIATPSHTPPELSTNGSNLDTTKLPSLIKDNQRVWKKQQPPLSSKSSTTKLPSFYEGKPDDQQHFALDSTPRQSDKELFERFKSLTGAHRGAEALQDLEQAKSNLREARIQYSTLTLAINQVKLEIDECALQLQGLEGCSTPNQHETEHQSVSLLQLQNAKKRYRTLFVQLQEKKAEVGYLGKIKAQMLQQVALEFQVWRNHQERSLERGMWPG